MVSALKTVHTTLPHANDKHNGFFNGKISSVGDPWLFGTDPDPRIRTSDLLIRIQIRIQLQIRLLSSVTLRMQKNSFFPIFFL